MDYMVEQTTIRKMRQSLEILPKSIEEAYEANLRRIDSQPSSKRKLAQRLLGWITHVKRRLSMSEILEAFAVEEGLDEIDPENIVKPQRLLATCVGLVITDPSDDTVRLIHTSAYEFFRDRYVDAVNVDTDIARTCISYLSLKLFQSGGCSTASDLKERFDRMHFLHYSVHYLGFHALQASMEADMTTSIGEFLEADQLRTSVFQALQFHPNLPDNLGEALLQSIPTGQSALHVAACWNLKEVATLLLNKSHDVTALDSQRWTPLHYACLEGHWDVAEVFVRNGADLNSQDSQGWTPLFWASFTGSVDIVKLLLDNQADHLVQSTLGWTALHWAVTKGHHAVVTLLLQHHRTYLERGKPSKPGKLVASLTYTEAVDFSETLRHDSKVSPLEIAANLHQKGIFDALVKEFPGMVDVESEVFNRIWAEQKFPDPVSNPWRTLQKGERGTGAELRRPWKFKVLSQSHMDGFGGRWYDCNSETIWKSILLMSAINEGHLTAAHLLIESGADVNFYCNTTALHAAAFQEDSSFAEMLLQKGADTSVLDEDGYVPLHYAVMNCYPAIVTLLADAGADLNFGVGPSRSYFRGSTRGFDNDRLGWSFSGARSKTPLILACGPLLLKSTRDFGAQETLDVLLDKGADPNIQDDDGITPLHYAATLPDSSAVSKLLSAGANPNILDQKGRSPLHFLATFSKVDQPFEVLEDVIDRLVLQCQEEDRTKFINKRVMRSRRASGASISSHRSSDAQAGVVPAPLDDNENGKDQGSAVSLSLKNGRWTVFDILQERDGIIPSNLCLTPILQDAVRELCTQMISKLLALGAKPEPSAIHDLTAAITSPGLRSTDYNGRRRDIVSSRTFIHQRGSRVCIDSEELVAFDAIVSSLLTSGDVDINWRSPGLGVAAIHMAARTPGAKDVLQILLQHGADPSLELGSGISPVILAALHQESAQLRSLLGHLTLRPGPNIRAAYATEHQDVSDYTLLCEALKAQDVIERQYYIGSTLLHLAAELDHVDLVQSLLSSGARKHAIDNKGFLPVQYAAKSKAWRAMKALWPPMTPDGRLAGVRLPLYGPLEMQSNECLHEWLDKHGIHAYLLDAVVEANDTEMAAYLFDLGVAESYKPPLYLAAKLGHCDMISLLVSRGAKIGHTNTYGWCSLHVAAFYGHDAAVEMLIKLGASIHVTTSHWGSEPWPSGLNGAEWRGQALHLAALQGHVGTVQILIQHGADVNASTGVYGDVHSKYEAGETQHIGPSCGPTALHNALSTGVLHRRTGECLDQNRLLVARILIEAGSEVHGVGDYLRVKDVLCFGAFEDVWDAVRVGITEKGRPL
jgi:ankyrin repeat protein